MLHRTSRTPFHARDRAMILLSVKAGLRACEIARLEWSMVLDARGKVTDILSIHDAIAKKRGGRRIPMHPDLRRALQSLKRMSEPSGPVIRSARGGHIRSTSVVNWFAALFRETRLRRLLVAFRQAHLPSPPPLAISTATAAVCATFSCSPGTDLSRRLRLHRRRPAPTEAPDPPSVTRSNPVLLLKLKARLCTPTNDGHFAVTWPTR
jgi:Phage integrase family